MITDQAEKLRRMAADRREAAPKPRTGGRKDAALRRRSPNARTFAVTSGKGGVGKTNISLNLAIAASRMGHRVVLLDADLGLANIDVLANLRARYNISHVVEGTRGILDIVAEGPAGVRIVPGASGLSGLADLDEGQRSRLAEQMEYLETVADVLIVDTAAGISKNVLQFLAAADDVVVIATPEPTSIIDSYATVKVLSQYADYGNIHLVLNMVEGRGEADSVSGRFLRVADDFLGVAVNYAGYVVRDQAFEDAVRCRQPLLMKHANSRAARCVGDVLRGLGVHRTIAGRGGSGFFRKFFSFFK